MATADEVREFVLVALIKPARRRGENTITLQSGEIHQAMGLADRMPLVCSSIDADKFLDYAGVTLVSRAGPSQSSTVTWVLEI